MLIGVRLIVRLVSQLNVMFSRYLVFLICCYNNLVKVVSLLLSCIYLFKCSNTMRLWGCSNIFNIFCFLHFMKFMMVSTLSFWIYWSWCDVTLVFVSLDLWLWCYPCFYFCYHSNSQALALGSIFEDIPWHRHSYDWCGRSWW